MTYTQEQRLRVRELVSRALEVVPVEQVLRELGLRSECDGSTLSGGVTLAGRDMGLDAMPEWNGCWRLMGSGFDRKRQTALCAEQVLPASQARGRTVLAVLEMWRGLASSKALTPPQLYPGLAYQAVQGSMAKLKIGTLVLNLDGPVLRQTVKWLRQRAEGQLLDEAADKTPVKLNFDGSLLKVEAGYQAYGIAARGNWAVPCTVELNDLLAVPPEVLRGGWVRMAWAPGVVMLNGHEMAILATGDAE